MFDPENPRDIGRLRQAMEYSRRQLRAFREDRHESIRQYAGHHFGDQAAHDRVPINLIELMVNIFSRQLAANNPQVYISTELEHLLPQAATMEIRVNRMIEEIKLVRT
ncbi:hypothetical protein LCGC14_2501180, partial [marine sediment metagenome]